MRKLDLNAVYISERVQETLRPIRASALTAVVAPMGYGKTTAINWAALLASSGYSQPASAVSPAAPKAFCTLFQKIERLSE